MEGLVSIDGKITGMAEAVVPAMDRSFLYADCIFETLVAFGEQILDMPDHFARLRRSAQKLRMPIPWSDAEMEAELKRLVHQLRKPKSALRLMITRGDGFSLKAPDKASPRKVIFCYPAKIEHKSVYDTGLALKPTQQDTTPRGATSKTVNYLPSIIALQDAADAGFDDILWINGADEVTEAATANIFFLGRDGDLLEVATPSAESGLLLGITRSRIITLLQKSGIPVTERIVDAAELARFDEAFVCSTVRGLVPIAKIGAHRLYTRRPHSTFNHIERLYLTWLESVIGRRVNWNTGEKQEPLQ